MKKLFLLTAIFIFSYFTSTAETRPGGCNSFTPGWGNSLGRVSFATNQTWTIGNQVWSDAVSATACANRSREFRGASIGEFNFNADCRSNPGFPGDLFSWCAVVRFQHQLCPYPWRVPTGQDFIDLDIAMGGTGQTRTRAEREAYPQFVIDNYINRWGGALGGGVHSSGRLDWQSSSGRYWSISERGMGSDHAFALLFAPDGWFFLPDWFSKVGGLSLRCVRND